MSLFEPLPYGVRDIPLEYLSVPDLIEARHAISPNKLTEVVRDTLGEEFVTACSNELIKLFHELPDHTDPSESHGDGILALILLRRFPSIALRENSFRYFASKSRSFKEVVYPIMVPLIHQLSFADMAQVTSNLIRAEAQVPSDDSGLEILHNLLGDDMFLHITVRDLIPNNIPFLLNHLDELPVLPEVVLSMFMLPDHGQAKKLFKKLITQRNVTLLEQYEGMDPKHIKELGEFLRRAYPQLYLDYRQFEDVYGFEEE